MRSKAPVVVFTTLFALASGSALALGDRAKDKKASTETTSSSQQSAQNPSGSGAPNTTAGMQSTPSSPAAGTTSSTAAPMSGTSNKAQTGQNDMRCDESKYASKSAMPKDCHDKGTGASASGSVQGQSGGASSK
jgi:hypothetical protein